MSTPSHVYSKSQSPPLSFSDVWSRELDELAVNAGPKNLPDAPAAESEKLKRLAHDVDSLPEPLTALCLSGGGIRSASFALGVLQALAGRGCSTNFITSRQFREAATLAAG